MSESGSQVVYVVDDAEGVLTAVCRLLRSVGLVTSAYSSAQEFLEHASSESRGCVVLDLSMPELDGLELQDALAAKGVHLPIVFITGHGDVPSSVRAMKQGAVDFLSKPVDESTLLDAVRTALEREASERSVREEVDATRERIASLSPREREVMQHVVAGLLNKQVALELGISEKTVKVHRARVMEKMGVQSLAELVRLVVQLGREDGGQSQT